MYETYTYSNMNQTVFSHVKKISNSLEFEIFVFSSSLLIQASSFHNFA